MDSIDYPPFLLRLLRAYGRKVASEDAEALAAMVSLYEQFGSIIRDAATGLTDIGISWNEIGAALQIPSTTARDRWQVRSLEPRGPVVYGLREIDTDEIRYVGASRNVSARFAQHRSQAYRGSAPVYTWIRAISVTRLELVILQRIELPADLDAAERFWIAKLSAAGDRLTNVIDNEMAPRVDSDEADARLADDWRAARNRKDRERRAIAAKRHEVALQAEASEVQALLRRSVVEDGSPFWRRERARVISNAEVLGLNSEVVKRLSTTELWPLVLRAREVARRG